MAEEKKGLRDEDRAALLTMRAQVNRDGNGLVAYTLDDKPLPPEQMTPAQREAIKRFEAVAFPLKQVEPVEMPPAPTATKEAPKA